MSYPISQRLQMVSPVPEPTSLSPLLGTLLPQGPRCFAWGGPHCAHLCIPLGTDSMRCPAHEEGFTLSIYLLSVLPATYLRYLPTHVHPTGRQSPKNKVGDSPGSLGLQAEHGKASWSAHCLSRSSGAWAGCQHQPNAPGPKDN